MVRGLEKFKEYFGEYAGRYVLIGGTACDILLENMDAEFRVTRDFDMVLFIELIDEEFVENFLKFVEDGGYEHFDKGKDQNQFFRFSKPKDNSFPVMIELFCRRPDYIETISSRLAPIHINENVQSLSAILLDDEYYDFLKSGVSVIDGVSVLGLEHIILFKMKAWLDLSDRKERGERVDSKDVRKHLNDVFRLSANMDIDVRIPIQGNVKKDAERFLTRAKNETIDLKGIGIRNVTMLELIERIQNSYELA